MPPSNFVFPCQYNSTTAQYSSPSKYLYHQKGERAKHGSIPKSVIKQQIMCINKPAIYRVIQEGRSIIGKVTISVIMREKCSYEHQF
jgi:hypothetical protein